MYGGTIKILERRKVSEHDPRTQQQLLSGDRMSRIEHNYAPVYEECLRPYLHKENKKLVIAEVGILKGTGLALWSDLFEHARILGFDIDLSYVHENMPDLIARGHLKAIIWNCMNSISMQTIGVWRKLFSRATVSILSLMTGCISTKRL